MLIEEEVKLEEDTIFPEDLEDSEVGYIPKLLGKPEEKKIIMAMCKFYAYNIPC